MGEIIGGVIVMVAFVAFVMWKNKGKTPVQDEFKRLQEEQYWAEKDAQETNVVSAESDDDPDD